MEPESALVASLLGIGGIAYLGLNRAQIREDVHHRWLVGGFFLALLGLLSACLASLFAMGTIDLLATAAFAGSTFAFGNWCRLADPMFNGERQ